MLDIMEKKVTTDRVYQTIANCVKLELHTPLQDLIMGMPGESRTTVTETAEFVSSLRFILGKDWNITNTFLAIATELGIIGLVIFISVILYIMRKLFLALFQFSLISALMSNCPHNNIIYIRYARAKLTFFEILKKLISKKPYMKSLKNIVLCIVHLFGDVQFLKF